jgi:PHP family Zn ribbon phosphoesterase
LTIGVWHRVDELANRAASAVEERERVPFRSIVPLAEVAGVAMGAGKASKKVKAEVAKLVADGRSEFFVLLDLPEAELARIAPPEIVSGILNMRAGRVDVRPGYDGEYGSIRPLADRASQSILL